MKSIVERLHERHQIDLAKSILQSNGYEVSLKESAIDDFWDLYDRDVETGTRLTDIARSLGIDVDEEPTEEEARRILSVYRGGSHKSPDEDELLEEIIAVCEDIDGVSHVATFEEKGLMTQNKGFVITTRAGQEFQFSLLGSYSK